MTGIAVRLMLDQEEADVVQEILEERHRTLLLEIAHTHHHHFKIVLQKKAVLLESLLSRLTEPLLGRAANQ